MVFPGRSIHAVFAGFAVFLAGYCGLGAGRAEDRAERPAAPSQVHYVLELFTSQGCSSCPRADRWLAAIAREPHVVALSFPVDYWDFIGWRDTLASPAFTARQKAYAVQNHRHVYTPQVVVNGLTDAPGSDEKEIKEAMRMAEEAEGAMSVPLRLFTSDGHYFVEVAEGAGGPAGVFALRVVRAVTVQILRGENAGQSLTYTNVVRTIDKLGDWTGATKTFNVPGEPKIGEGFVVLLQKGTLERPGAILAAAKTEGL
ncbi:MAG TPA: DUF1223 domain-containing protein [Methylocella sp.]|nr:DUF1223 domain-containing protein [Methylocella sp.]